MTSFAPRGYATVSVSHTSAVAPGTSPLARAQAAVKARNFAEAAKWFEKACQEHPDDAQTQAWLGQSLSSIGRRDEGIAHLREAGRGLLKDARETGNINLVLEVAGQLQHWSDFPGALELLSAAVQINPHEFRGYQLLAVTFAQLNQKAEALVAGEQALKLSPENNMMQVFQGSLEADAGKSEVARERLQRVLATQPNAREAFRAHKELARVLDKLGVYCQVFSHLHASGNLSRSLPEYAQQDASLIPNMLKANRAGFDRQLLSRWAGTEFPLDQPAPNFVLGFMRSGTTLTQEVLDAHPDVFVADEIDFVSAMKRELHERDRSNISTAEKLSRLDLPGVLHLREFYWKRVRERFGDAIEQRLFVDKFTMNTVDLGLINCVFPDAKVVFVMRDPRDVCLSCFMQLMVPTPTTVQLLSWEGTAKFYAEVMEWWMYIKQQMTLQFIEFRYEDVVSDFEQTYRKVFDFLGITWDAAVVDFHKSAARKFIATPSRSQVTQPLYASSVAKWRCFESDFAPINGVLAPYIRAFNYHFS
ncbi:MAG: sulfotransferase [Rhodoferax sp.]|uniref:tetratricopeptide repeat-containing sulfotransferase family protein n=1 Tax=Rhodoferax sp. TaxID=50421 RepID=UPI0027273AFC|nr:tetratricopeptide repeat-containing sulfotransferase family protein [Rhodoferax sp.]MDO8451093.1 sulfotransferase [Rhodoferax sp.]